MFATSFGNRDRLRPGTMKIHRTYPQPDAPGIHLGPRERALNVFKYLLDMEPEEACKHPLFRCIEHAFVQCHRQMVGDPQEESLVDMLRGTRELEPDGLVRYEDTGL